MATLTHKNYISVDVPNTKAAIWSVPVGRFLYGLIFILSAFGHFSSESIQYAEAQGVPIAAFLVPASGLLALAGGLSVALGYHARIGSILLMLFLIPVTIMMHDYWTISDPQEAQMEMTHFMKNLSMFGASLLIYCYGAGPISIDYRKGRH